MFATLRLHRGCPTETFSLDRGFGSWGISSSRRSGGLDPGFLRGAQPIVRHTVFRRRETLEELGLLETDRV